MKEIKTPRELYFLYWGIGIKITLEDAEKLLKDYKEMGIVK